MLYLGRTEIFEAPVLRKPKECLLFGKEHSGIQLTELTAEIKVLNAMQDRVIDRDCRSRIGTILIVFCRFHTVSKVEVCPWTKVTCRIP